MKGKSLLPCIGSLLMLLALLSPGCKNKVNDSEENYPRTFELVKTDSSAPRVFKGSNDGAIEVETGHVRFEDFWSENDGYKPLSFTLTDSSNLVIRPKLGDNYEYQYRIEKDSIYLYNPNTQVWSWHFGRIANDTFGSCTHYYYYKIHRKDKGVIENHGFGYGYWDEKDLAKLMKVVSPIPFEEMKSPNDTVIIWNIRYHFKQNS